MTRQQRFLLRGEGAAVALLLACLAWQSGPSLWLVAAVLVAPDLAIAAYRLGPKHGALVYNAAHSYIGPALLWVEGLLWPSETCVQVATLWALHIAGDRALGLGLKGETGFRDTHLGRIGSGRS